MNQTKQFLSRVMFASRWLQLPLYFGLIIILAVYAYRFIGELYHLVSHLNGVTDTQIMLGVLDLIDVVMIANLLIMVTMGGYETFVSKLELHAHPDQPEWLDHLDAGAMKLKLALALIGISSIHLLRTFIDPAKLTNNNIMWQVIIHVTLLVSALSIAWVNLLLVKSKEH
ncbi:TIGR00645 family protein [Legionella dresdenensis]|uniref:UPF0114 protein ACFORL_04865 n=1 Tax=Legionella dresdenensis TaxID=450200 RepID=A0ABV8CDX1_9GAMM